jgi:SAM-dependent methyltransferase
MVPLDYFTIGRRLALRSTPPAAWEPKSTYRAWEFAILEPGPTCLGTVIAEARNQWMDVRLRWFTTPRGAEDQVEAIRLIAMVCRKATAAELRLDCGPVDANAAEQLFAVGFEACGTAGWRYPYGLTPNRDTKVESVAACSADPFIVPWNFEPRQWEVLGPFLADIQNSMSPDHHRVLEIGCGFGRNAVLLEERNLDVYGIDLAFDAIRQCRRWVRHPERFVTASVNRLPYADGTFEGVLDIGCLHCADTHLLDDAVDEVARVLLPSGRLYSRFFKPRNRSWIDAQPYQIDAVGLDFKTFTKMLERRFTVTAWEQPDMTCVRAVPRSM